MASGASAGTGRERSADAPRPFALNGSQGAEGVQHADGETAPAGGAFGAEESTPTGSGTGGGWMAGPGIGGKPNVHEPLRWRPSLGSGISVTRDIPVEITRDTLRICNGEVIPITPDVPAEELARHVAEALEEQSRKWGPPPKGFYWKPRIKFIVTAEGAPTSGRLEPIVEMWGLDSTLDYASRLSRVADTPRPNTPRPNTPRTQTPRTQTPR